MPVGEIFLSAFLPVLFKKLASRELLNFVTEEGVRYKLKKWERKLKLIQALLSDAEEKRNIGAVKLWLDDLQDLAYDAEDILDEFATETLRRNSIAEDHHEASFSEARKLIPSSFKNYTPRAIKFDFSMRSKIKHITIRLEELCKERVELGLLVSSEGTSSSEQTLERRPPSSSVSTEPDVFGREEDKAKILEMVLSDEPSNASFSVIAIVGMGGIGKTTLVQEIYKDEKAASKFKKKIWVCVSDDFDVLKISKTLLESITNKSSSPNNLNDVQVKLGEELKGKRFLLVIDDVWNDNNHLWETLKSPFRAGAVGSKIIVTTRSKHIASTIRSSETYNLDLISKDDCLRLFKKHAFEFEKDDADRIRDSIYESVVEKCGGLPLAAKTLGGILRSKQIEEWENVLSSKIWDSPNASGILPVLRLSYHHLPSHLKRCFACCAIFPKDYEFEKKELVLWWIGEGIIQQSENKTQLDLAGQYFDHLLSVSLFQRSNRNNDKYIMHDLTHDLAESVFGEIGLRLERGNKRSKYSERVRHFSYISDDYEGKNKFKDLQKFGSLRTFLPIFMSPYYQFDPPYITAMVLFDLLSKLRKLRVLSLERYHITQIPDFIGGFIYLRYLNFSYTKIKSLPESTSSLLNLQILILKDCSLLKQLPSKMSYLTNLCCLDIKGADLLEKMPIGMKKLKNLQMLSNFILGEGVSSNLKDLKNLNFLLGELHISKLENVTDSKNIGGPILSDKKDLEVLLLEWRPKLNDTQNEDSEKVLEVLKPHKNLKELTIKHYGGSEFSSWLRDSSLLPKLAVLKLENCEKCTILPSLAGLSSLKNLTIIGLKRLKELDSQSIPFKSLEILHFENLEEWEHWNTDSENEDVQRFYHLHKLSIVNCPKFIGKLPDNLPSLVTLVIEETAGLEVSLSSFPKVCELRISQCKSVLYGRTSSADFHSPNSVALTSLKKLSIYNCRSLHFFPQIFFLPNLSSLEICKCEAPQSLPKGLKENNLKELIIIECNFLTSIARDTLPQSLKSVYVRGCEKLQCVVRNTDHNCASSSSSAPLISEDNFSKCLLENLSIRSCPSITCISSKGELPMTLKELTIIRCSEFTTLSTSKLPTAIEVLHVHDCPKIESIAETFDNCSSLKHIYLLGCEALKFIPSGLHNLNCLRDIYIDRCPCIISLPEGGLPNTISSVTISKCENFEGLVVDHLHSLDDLSLSSCPKIEMPLKLPNCLTSLCIVSLSFTTERLSTTLTNLTVLDSVKFCKQLIEIELNNLTSVRNLAIGGCKEAEPIFQEDNRMPTSLIGLEIWDLPKLEYLSSKGFQSLIWLQSLEIRNCPELRCIPKLDSLISLERLLIRGCPKLKSFPSLPSSLLELDINNCPQLKRQCKRGKGKYWWKIKDIPRVEINDKFIYDLEEEKE